MTTYRLTPRVAALTTLIVKQWGPSSTEARQIAQLGEVLPRVLRVLWLDTPDGYPTSTPGAPDRGGSASAGSPDKLGSLVARRERTTATYSLLCAAVGRASEGVALMDRNTVRDALSAALRVTDGCQDSIEPQAYTTLKERLTCCRKQDNDDGSESWVDPLCENIADQGRQGMCEPCYRRRYNYMRREAEQQQAS
jgi:hypothetical protein